MEDRVGVRGKQGYVFNPTRLAHVWEIREWESYARGFGRTSLSKEGSVLVGGRPLPDDVASAVWEVYARDRFAFAETLVLRNFRVPPPLDDSLSASEALASLVHARSSLRFLVWATDRRVHLRLLFRMPDASLHRAVLVYDVTRPDAKRSRFR